MKRLAIAFALSLVASAASAQHSGGAHKMVMPSDLKWAAVPSLPPGAQLSVIEGPAIERVTVLSGTFHMGTGDKLDKTKTHPLTPGAIGIMQPGTNHFAWTDAETIVQLNGNGPWGVTYVNPADDPRRTQ